MLRNTFAILAGFVLWTVLWLGGNGALVVAMPAAFPTNAPITVAGPLLLLLALSIICSLAGGWLLARIASQQSTEAAMILGVLLLAVGIFVQSQSWALLPLWFHLSFLALLIPGVFLGKSLSTRA